MISKVCSPFIGNTFNGDISETMKIFNWKPIPLKKTVLDTAKSVEEAMYKTVSKLKKT